MKYLPCFCCADQKARGLWKQDCEFPAIFFKIGSWKNSAIIKVKIMATNAEVDCNEKDFTVMESQKVTF